MAAIVPNSGTRTVRPVELTRRGVASGLTALIFCNAATTLRYMMFR